MAASHHKRGGSHRSNRSNRYSESKSTNLRSFEPFGAESWNFPLKLKPAAEVDLGGGTTVPVYEKTLHGVFTRP